MVRCADCGFYGLRHRATREICEAEASLRESGELIEELHEPFPVCFKRVVDFRDEPPETHYWKQKRAQSATRERQCIAFTKWHQGFTPKEHAEMIAHDELRERERRWRAEDIARIEAQHRQSLLTHAFVAVLAALIGAFIAAVATVFASGR